MIVDAVTIATAELEDYMEQIAQSIAPTCSGCRWFQQSDRMPGVGRCGWDTGDRPISAGQMACSQYQFKGETI